MGRPLRIEYPGALYHITSRGNDEIIEKERFTKNRAPEEIIKEVAKTFGIKEGLFTLYQYLF
ncbi:MAG: hypothetical protein AB1606_03455 [Nitrospirota bacterium]